MAFTTNEEALLKDLLESKAEIDDLAASYSAILSKLATAKVAISDLPSVTEYLSGDETLIVRDGTAKRLPVDLLKGEKGDPGDITTEEFEAALAEKAEASAIGIGGAAADMGTFTGATIPDNVTAKAALQSLETALEAATLTTLTAGEDISAGNLVNIYASSGIKVRKANATDETKPADAFVNAAIADTASGPVYYPGNVVTGLSGLAPGARYYLSTTGGQITSTPPSGAGNLVQEVGVALSSTTLLFAPKQGTLLA